MYLKLTILVASLAGVLGQLQMKGTCDTIIKGMDSFDMSKMKHGVWYALQGVGEGPGTTCPALRITKTENGVLEYYRMFVQDAEDDVDKTVLKNIPYQVRETTTLPATGTITMMSDLFTMVDTENVPYSMLLTDHETFGLLYHCKQNSPDTKTVTAWKLSTTKTLTDEAASRLSESLNRHPELRNIAWKTYDQTNCDLFSV